MCKHLRDRFDPSKFPNSDEVMERGVLLPLHHGMTNLMFTRLHSTIDQFIKERKI